jgi:chemotaxis receptor (MCP) glutamine deamidase CheD
MREQLRQYLQLRINGKQFDFPTHFAIPSHVLQVAKCLGAAKARLAKRLFHGKKTLTHTIPISVENNSSVSGFLSFMRFKIVAFCEGQPEKIWTSLPQRRLHTFTKVKI